MGTVAEQLTLVAWRAAGATERADFVHRIVAASAGALEAVRTAGNDEVPVFLHGPTQALFHLVPGGTWRHGFSREEYDSVYEQYRGWWEADTADAICEDARQLPAPYDVRLPAFLFAARPFDASQIALLGTDEPAAYETIPREGSRLGKYDHVVGLPADEYLRYLTQVEEGTLALEAFDLAEDRLRRRGLRLPTHDEWEAASRAGGRTAFAVGSRIPKTPNAGVNRFGFVGMGAWAEVVAGPRERPGFPPERAARGGAATCYPWQDCGEWTLLLCALRTSAAMFEGLLSLRPVMDLS